MVEAEDEFKEVILCYVEYQTSLMYMRLKKIVLSVLFCSESGFPCVALTVLELIL